VKTVRIALPLALALLMGSAAAGSVAVAQPAASKLALSSNWNGKSYRTSWDLYQAMKAGGKGAKRTAAAALPNWKGIWTRSFDGAVFAFGAGQPSNPQLTPEYGLPVGAKLTPEYQAKWEKKVADVARGVEWDQLSNCLPAGFPRVLTEPFLREFVVTPEETWLIAEQQSEARRVYTDGRAHVPDDEAFPLWEGDSIGFWDGDTLVVHTNNLKPGQYQRGQPDYSDKTTSVERIRRTSPDVITDEVWVYDPASLLDPWHVAIHYERVNEPVRINMWSCAENNNVVKTGDGASTFILPGERGYQDPKHLGQGGGK
jgi:hypothetical protein